MAVVTQESVAAAAEAILERGDRATVKRVRVELGGGSPNDILPLLNQWKDARPADAPEQSGQEAAGQPHAAEFTDLSALPSVRQALEQLSDAVLETVTGLVGRERSAAASIQRAIQAAADHSIAQVRQEAERQIADVAAKAKADIGDAREEAAELAAQLAEKEAEVAALIADRDAKAAEIRESAVHNTKISKWAEHEQKQNAPLRARAEEAEARAAAAEARIDALIAGLAAKTA